MGQPCEFCFYWHRRQNICQNFIFLVFSSCCNLILADIRQQGGSFYLFYDDEEEKWVDTRFFFGATIFNRLENDNSNYCVDSYSNW